MTTTDRVIRAMTEDGAFRIVALRATDLAREACRLHGVSGDQARIFSELLAGSVLARETISPPHRLQSIFQTPQGWSVIADSRQEEGLTRGLVQQGKAQHTTDVLQIIRRLPHGKMHQSVVEADANNLTTAFMTYMYDSAKVESTMVVRAVMADGHVAAVGGYMLQLLPEHTHGQLAIMTERLQDFAFIDQLLLKHDADPQFFVDELFYGWPFAILADEPLAYGCEGDRARALAAIQTLGKEEIEKLLAENPIIKLDCEYCLTEFEFGRNELMGMLDEN